MDRLTERPGDVMSGRRGAEGYIRLSITIPDSRLEEGCERVRKALVGR